MAQPQLYSWAVLLSRLKAPGRRRRLHVPFCQKKKGGPEPKVPAPLPLHEALTQKRLRGQPRLPGEAIDDKNDPKESSFQIGVFSHSFDSFLLKDSLTALRRRCSFWKGSALPLLIAVRQSAMTGWRERQELSRYGPRVRGFSIVLGDRCRSSGKELTIAPPGSTIWRISSAFRSHAMA